MKLLRPTNLFIILLPLCSTAAIANPLDEAARLLEETNMERLHQQQTRPGVVIDEFRSDGCSGGLSDSWKTLARLWPEMAHAIGEQPPWESCCVEHDRAYWRGESIDGFDKRLRADTRLSQCVEQSGQQRGEEIARRLGISRAEIDEIFSLTAELMFFAVRIGGGPCSGLEWRWGHGWPPCGSDAEPTDDDAGLLQVERTRHRLPGARTWRPQTDRDVLALESAVSKPALDPSAQVSSGVIRIAPQGHSAAHMPQPLQ